MAAGFVLGVLVFVFFPLPSACFLQSGGVMSATLIMSAGGTDDPHIQQQRAAGESEVAAALDKEQQRVGGNPAGQSVSLYKIHPCKKSYARLYAR